MDCRFDKELLEKYVNEDIDQLELIFLSEHLSNCKECSEYLDSLKKASISDTAESFRNTTNEISNEEKKYRYFNFCKQIKFTENIIRNSTRFAVFLPGVRLITRVWR